MGCMFLSLITDRLVCSQVPKAIPVIPADTLIAYKLVVVSKLGYFNISNYKILLDVTKPILFIIIAVGIFIIDYFKFVLMIYVVIFVIFFDFYV